jgi:hypothetical protein
MDLARPDKSPPIVWVTHYISTEPGKLLFHGPARMKILADHDFQAWITKGIFNQLAR